MDQKLRTKPGAGGVQGGAPVDLLPLLASYGRDRRVALRVERMPSRARLSRGRNNGDGSWSLTRDELEGLCYIPAKGAQEWPTLSVRVIGLDSDNGATLAVLDYSIAPEDEPENLSTDDEEDVAQTVQREAELRQLRSELAKAKASLRTIHTELAAARKSFEQELEEHLSEAAEEAAAALERTRTAWHAETKERLAKAEARAQEKITQALERGRREAEVELSASQDEAARSEAVRSASQDAELNRLRREISAMRTAVADQERKLAAAQSSTALARDEARREAVIAFAKAEEGWKKEETERLAAAEAKWHAQSERALKEIIRRAELAEAELANARTESQSARDRHETNELRRLRDELATTQSALSERESKLMEAQAQARRARDEAQHEAAAALVKAEKEWKAGEAQRFATAEGKWTQHSARALEETAERLARSEAALADARAESKSTRRDSAELRRLRAELALAEKKLAEREDQLAEAEVAAGHAHESSEAIETALAQAAKEWKAGEGARLAAAERKWREQSARVLAESEKKLARAEAELVVARADSNAARKTYDPAETRRLKELFAEAQLTLAKREAELADAREALKRATERAKQETAAALAQAEKKWELRAQDESERLMKKATMKLEAAEAALAEARAEASQMHDRRDSEEFRRLRTEFASLREKLGQKEAELAETKMVAGRTRERTREEVESALGKAEEAWKAQEAIRIADAESCERQRGARVVAEATARADRSEGALRDVRAQMESERERNAIDLAEANARIERLESHLSESRSRIETLRDPVNETELHRVRNELAAMQIACGEREAELAQARAAARKTRERWTEHVKAAVMRAEDAWRLEEAERLNAARREWERDAKLADALEMTPEGEAGSSRGRRTKRLFFSGAVAVGFVVIVLLGVTFYPRFAAYWPSTAPASGREVPNPTAGLAQAAAPAPKIAAPNAVVTAALVHVRATPDMAADIIANLPRGAQVVSAEQHGTWTHVLIAGANGKPGQSGWVRGISLKPLASPTQAASQ